MKSFVVLTCLVVCGVAQGRLEPTKIEDNGLYKLEIQSEDKFLTSSDENLAARSRWANKLEQKWQFKQVVDGSEIIMHMNIGSNEYSPCQIFTTGSTGGWKLMPLGGREIPILWKISYVGHGKYRFLNQASGLCLAGVGSKVVTERPCEKDSPYQRWLVLQTKP